MSDQIVLRARGVAKVYAEGSLRTEVLQSVDFALRRGETLAIVGASGSGKSTLLHILGGLDTPSAGEVEVAGQRMSTLSDAARGRLRNRALGFIYQFHHLLPEFTALENIVLPQLANAVPRKEAEARARGLLERVGLAGRMSHRPSALSGGEQQRVASCQTPANTPKLLLADEPTGNLDPATSDQVFSALMDVVRDTGLSALIATHNMELAARMDRVVRLKDGQVV